MSRPTYRRPTPQFAELFGLAPDLVIAAMDRAGDDVPHQSPSWPLALATVGVERERVPVRVADPFGSDAVSTLDCRLKVSTQLPPEKRGIHMSRLNHVIADAATRAYPGLDVFARDVARAVGESQYGGPSEVEVSGWFPFWEGVSGRDGGGGKTSLEHVELSAAAHRVGDVVRLSYGVAVEHITACPCVQMTLAHATAAAGPAAPASDKNAAPAMTHSQRCRSQVVVSDYRGALPFRALFQAIDGVVFRTQNTLPREHELALVYRAHAGAQFIEDVVRDLVVACHGVLRADHPAAVVGVTSRSMESIHSFDIFASARVALKDLDKLVAAADRD